MFEGYNYLVNTPIPLMNKAFVKEDAPDEEEGRPAAPALPAGTKNYMTRRGYGLLRNELEELVKRERPALVQVVSWAAKNGDRSENGDYIYGKHRLREIDRRVRYLSRRLEQVRVVRAPPTDRDRDRSPTQSVSCWRSKCFRPRPLAATAVSSAPSRLTNTSTSTG